MVETRVLLLLTILWASNIKCITIDQKALNRDNLDILDSWDGTTLANDSITDSDVFIPENLPEGWTCMNKVVLTEYIEYDEELVCTHSFNKSCFQTYSTVFKPTKVVECREIFYKECYLEYMPVPKSVNVLICNDPLKRDCDIQGETVCSNEYETVCELIDKENPVTDDVPECGVVFEEQCESDDPTSCTQVPRTMCNITQEQNMAQLTDCKKIPRQICGPETCPIVKGERTCRNKRKTVVDEVPQESCNMVPHKICDEKTKLIPSVVPNVTCIEIPSDVCATARVNPRKIKKPLVKRWCGPAESGKKRGDVVFVSVQPKDDTVSSFKFYQITMDKTNNNQTNNKSIHLACERLVQTSLATDYAHHWWSFQSALTVTMRGHFLMCGSSTCRAFDFGQTRGTKWPKLTTGQQVYERNSISRDQFGWTSFGPNKRDLWLVGGQLQYWVDPDPSPGSGQITSDVFHQSNYSLTSGPGLPEPLDQPCVARINSTHIALISRSWKGFIYNELNKEFTALPEVLPSFPPFFCGAANTASNGTYLYVIEIIGFYTRFSITSWTWDAFDWEQAVSISSDRQFTGSVQLSDTFVLSADPNSAFVLDPISAEFVEVDVDDDAFFYGLANLQLQGGLPDFCTASYSQSKTDIDKVTNDKWFSGLISSDREHAAALSVNVWSLTEKKLVCQRNITTLPESTRKSFFALLDDGKALICGEQYWNTRQCYSANLATTSGPFWSEETPLEIKDLQMVKDREFCAQAVIGPPNDRRIHVVGGLNNEAAFTTEIFSFNDLTFAPGPDLDVESHYFGCVARLNDTHSVYGTYSLTIINWDTQEKRLLRVPDEYQNDFFWSSVGCGVAKAVNGTQLFMFHGGLDILRYTLLTDTWEKLPLEAIVLQPPSFAKSIVQLDKTFLIGSIINFLIYDTTHGTFNDTGIAAPQYAADAKFMVIDQLPDYCKLPN